MRRQFRALPEQRRGGGVLEPGLLVDLVTGSQDGPIFAAVALGWCHVADAVLAQSRTVPFGQSRDVPLIQDGRQARTRETTGGRGGIGERQGTSSAVGCAGGA